MDSFRFRSQETPERQFEQFSLITNESHETVERGNISAR